MGATQVTTIGEIKIKACQRITCFLIDHKILETFQRSLCGLIASRMKYKAIRQQFLNETFNVIPNLFGVLIRVQFQQAIGYMVQIILTVYHQKGLFCGFVQVFQIACIRIKQKSPVIFFSENDVVIFCISSRLIRSYVLLKKGCEKNLCSIKTLLQSILLFRRMAAMEFVLSS